MTSETKKNKQAAWDYALGLIQIDGLKPTYDFLEMVNKEIRGEMTLEEIEKSLSKKYKMKDETILEDII